MSAGHTSAVIELASCAARPGLLASLSKDGNLRFWDVLNETCLGSFAADATAMVCKSSFCYSASVATGGIKTDPKTAEKSALKNLESAALKSKFCDGRLSTLNN